METPYTKEEAIVWVIKEMRASMMTWIKWIKISQLLASIPEGIEKIMLRTTMHDINNLQNIYENLDLLDAVDVTRLWLSPDSIKKDMRSKLRSLILAIKDPNGMISFNSLIYQLKANEWEWNPIEIFDIWLLRKLHDKNISKKHACALLAIFDEIFINMHKYWKRWKIITSRDNNILYIHISNGLKNINELVANSYSSCQWMDIIKDNLWIIWWKISTTENIYNWIYSFAFTIPESIFLDK